jgi:nucleoside 2-deoxyribosyltransferase
MSVNRKPKVFIAAPFFNSGQVAVVERIEQLCEKNGLPFYSARLHAGTVPPEKKKDPTAWKPVFANDVQGIHDSDFLVAVLDYKFPNEDGGLYVHEPGFVDDAFPIEIPDTGTVWEMGYAFSIGRPVVGFTLRSVEKLNLMLMLGVRGIVEGYEHLDTFLHGERKVTYPIRWRDAAGQPWEPVWDALKTFRGEVE